MARLALGALRYLTITLQLPNQIRNAQIRMYENKAQLQKMNERKSDVLSNVLISPKVIKIGPG